MPQGQTLGPRRYFGYTSDSGDQYSLLLDETLGVIGGMELNDTSPPPPRRFRPRGVYVEAIVAGTKVRKFIATEADVSLYRTDSSASVPIDGVTFSTTGRRGERMTFGSNPAIAGP